MSIARRTEARHRPGPRPAGMPMTAAGFDAADVIDDHRFHRYELIRGTLVVTPPPVDAEADPIEELGDLPRKYGELHPDGSALDLTIHRQIIPTGDNRRVAHRVVWAGLGRRPDVEDDIPAIVIDFVTRSRRDHRRDYEVKLAEYLAAGITEYWIIDRFGRKMVVHRRQDDGSSSEVVVDASGTYRTPLLPGFELPLARLLAQADLWPAKTRRRKPSAGGIT